MAIELTNIVEIYEFKQNGEKGSDFKHKSEFDPTDYTLLETITSTSEPVQVWIFNGILEQWNAS